jgi:hypothetical protein
VLALATAGLCAAGMTGAPAIGVVLVLVLGVMPLLTQLESTPDWLFALMPPLSVTDLVGGTTIAGTEAVAPALAVAGLAVWVLGGLGAGLARMRRADV